MHDLAAPRLDAAHEGPSVDIRRLQGAAPYGDAVRSRAALDQHVERAPDERLPERGGHVVDRLAELGGALEGERRRGLPGQRRSRSTLLGVVGEHAGGGEPGLAHEGEELVELLVGLAGKPGDEGPAHGGAWERDAYAREKVEISGGVAAALHAPQNGAGGVLEGDVHVRHLSLIHISEPTRLGMTSYAVFCLKKKKKKNKKNKTIHNTIKTKKNKKYKITN